MELSKGNFVEFACKRPKFYTCHCTVSEMIALLVGFEEGNRHHSPEHRDRSAGKVLQWLAKEYGQSGGGPKNAAFMAESLLKEFGSDQAAILAIEKYATSLLQDGA